MIVVHVCLCVCALWCMMGTARVISFAFAGVNLDLVPCSNAIHLALESGAALGRLWVA